MYISTHCISSDKNQRSTILLYSRTHHQLRPRNWAFEQHESNRMVLGHFCSTTYLSYLLILIISDISLILKESWHWVILCTKQQVFFRCHQSSETCQFWNTRWQTRILLLPLSMSVLFPHIADYLIFTCIHIGDVVVDVICGILNSNSLLIWKPKAWK